MCVYIYIGGASESLSQSASLRAHDTGALKEAKEEHVSGHADGAPSVTKERESLYIEREPIERECEREPM